jgi:DnaJ-class molecular chaperone
MNYYRILGVKEDDSIEHITKKYKELAKKYHPDRNPLNTEEATEKCKDINVAFDSIKKKHNTYSGFNTFNKDDGFKHFTEKIINKGEFINTMFNKAKTINMAELLDTMFKNIKKIRFYYDDIFSETSTEDINITINVELEDIYNSEEKIINLVRNRKCIECFSNDIAFCKRCNNKIYYEQEKCFLVNCSEKIIVFSGESNEEKNKRAGDINIRIFSKKHPQFHILNNYDIVYYIFSTEKDIIHEFEFLDGQLYIFECTYPYSEFYIIENKGLCIPYSTKRGNLIIKVVPKMETNTNFKLYLNNTNVNK